MSLSNGSKFASFVPSVRKDPKPLLPAKTVNFSVSRAEFKEMVAPQRRRVTEDDVRAFRKRVEKRRRNKS